MINDIAASIRARLFNLAKEREEEFDFVLRQFVMQRLLYRLSVSEYREQFLLKGALLFWVWNTELHRPTVDIDLLGFGSNDVKTLKDVFINICEIESEDGLTFDVESINGIEIKEDAKYQGVRITGFAYLTKAKIRFQIDVGFGDAVTPAPESALLPSFLDLPAARLRIYPIYTVIAEKFQAMVDLDLANSRIKDFYDIWIIAGQVEIEGKMLVEAVKATFKQRNTQIINAPLNIFSEAFKRDDKKQIQWRAFLNKNHLAYEFGFSDLMIKLSAFLLPVYESCVDENNQWPSTWSYNEWKWRPISSS